MRSRDIGTPTMRMWGCLLRGFRIAAGVTYDQLAQYVGYSKSLIVGIERGIRTPSQQLIVKADEFLGAGGRLIEAAAHLTRDEGREWPEEYAEEEMRSRSLWIYDTHTLHHLARTEDYTRAMLHARRPVLAEEEIDTRLKAEHHYQTLLDRRRPCSVSLIVEESVLRRPIGGPAVMKAQLEHLADLARLRNVTLQVMPTAQQVHTGLSGPMTLMEDPNHVWLAHLEIQDTSRLITDRTPVSTLHDRYTSLRSHALTPTDTHHLITHIAQAFTTKSTGTGKEQASLTACRVSVDD